MYRLVPNSPPSAPSYPQVLGLALLAFGIWLVAVADSPEEAGDSYKAGGALLIVSGIVTAAICAVGVVGVIHVGLFRPLLVIVSLVCPAWAWV